MNFANHIERTARDDPEKTALTGPDRSVTFAELSAETDEVAAGLAELGVGAGDRIALYLPNSVTFVAAFFGAMKRGAIPVPVNMRFVGEEVRYVLDDAGAVLAVTNGGFAADLASIETDDLEHVVVDGETPSGTLAYEAFLETDRGVGIHPRKEDELADIMYTSGTTGRPKGVMHTHRNLSTNARALLGSMEWSRHDIGLTANPCFHVSGLHVTVSPFLASGTTNHLVASWDPGRVLGIVEERGVTTSFLIATMIVDLVNFADADDYDTSSLSVVGCGGAPMPKERIETFEETFDCQLIEGYGMTETTPAAAINRPGDAVRKPGSIGPVIEEVVDVRIEDPESGALVDRGELGELLWHGDTVTPGYFGMPEKNEEAFVERPIPGGAPVGGRGGRMGKWLRSGDIGRMDEDGHLFLEDRIDDMIITGGENVYPREVEDVIYGIDGVEEAAVLGTPDERLGELITAVVVAEGVTAETIESACREQLAGYKVPRRVEFVDEMPKTSTRKIDKMALREQL